MQTQIAASAVSLAEMWIFSCFLIGSMASSLQGLNETVTKTPTATPPPTAASTSFYFLMCVLLSAGSVCLALMLFLMVLLVRKYVYDKPVCCISACKKDTRHQLTYYCDIIRSDRKEQPIRWSTETDSAAGHSTVRTEDVSYAEIIIKDTGNRSKREFQPEPNVIYSTVK
ncbi:uncharacterized protein LOC143415710 [Maylandia zebra]|uniref:uncharacterized protein LOC143415710 n=1 Tax=Maylandia zebra TaxID=106582 RepID=UPI00403CA107